MDMMAKPEPSESGPLTSVIVPPTSFANWLRTGGTNFPSIEPSSLPEHIRKNQRCDNHSVRLDHEPRRLGIQLVPGQLLVRHRPAVRSIRSRAIADLAEIRPVRDLLAHSHVDAQEWNSANRKIPGNSPADLKESNSFPAAVLFVPIAELHHVLDAPAHAVRDPDFSLRAH